MTLKISDIGISNHQQANVPKLNRNMKKDTVILSILENFAFLEIVVSCKLCTCQKLVCFSIELTLKKSTLYSGRDIHVHCMTTCRNKIATFVSAGLQATYSRYMKRCNMVTPLGVGLHDYVQDLYENESGCMFGGQNITLAWSCWYSMYNNYVHLIGTK